MGSSTIQPIVEEAAPKFEATHPGVVIEIQGGGSGAGVKGTREGKAQIGTVSRALKDDETDLQGVKVGDDGIALVVHKDNPLTNITKEQVQRLYQGEITRWSEVGGKDAPVTLITKEEGRSTLELFAKHFALEGKIKKDAIVIGPNGQALKTLEGNPDAIAYVSIGSAEKSIEQGAPLKILNLDGVAATAATVRGGSYPLRRPLLLVTKGPASGTAKEFIDFVTSPEGQKIVTAQDFVPLAK
jgi:phosphate transport system substrate-binding protein